MVHLQELTLDDVVRLKEDGDSHFMTIGDKKIVLRPGSSIQELQQAIKQTFSHVF